MCVYVNKKIPHKTYICMFRWQDTLDMHVYSKNTSKICTCLGSKIPHEKKKKKKKEKKKKKKNKQ